MATEKAEVISTIDGNLLSKVPMYIMTKLNAAVGTIHASAQTTSPAKVRLNFGQN